MVRQKSTWTLFQTDSQIKYSVFCPDRLGGISRPSPGGAEWRRAPRADRAAGAKARRHEAASCGWNQKCAAAGGTGGLAGPDLAILAGCHRPMAAVKCKHQRKKDPLLFGYLGIYF